MGCRISSGSSRRQKEEASRAAEAELQFSQGDLLELQTILWNLLILEGAGKQRTPSKLRKLVEEIRATTQNWHIPKDEELACQLMVETTEREEGCWDVHVVHKLETEEQVLGLLFDETCSVKMATLEILMQWYVHTSDCESMLRHVEASSHANGFPEATVDTFRESTLQLQEDVDGPVDDDPKNSLQSFVWKGSVETVCGTQTLADVLSPQLDAIFLSHHNSPAVDSVMGSTVRGQESLCGHDEAECDEDSYRGLPFVHAIRQPYNRPYLEQLAFGLRAALRAALRHFSTSHLDFREKQQRSNSQRMAGCEWSKDRVRAIERCGSLSGFHGLLLPPKRQHTLTVVLDLDETLVFARQGPLWVRPGVQQFLMELRSYDCEVVCWTASNRSYAGGILSKLDPKAEVVSQCIYSHPKWLRRSVGPQVKNLALVGRDMNYTIMIDNLPDSVVGNELNAIVVENYEGCELYDTTLPTLSKVIKEIIDSGSTVPDYLRDRSRSGAHLKYCEQRLVHGETILCFVLNSEPARFELPL